MSSPLHFRGRRPDDDYSVVDAEYGVERREETFVTPEKISDSVKSQGSRYALKTTVDAQDGWSYTRDEVESLVNQYCRTSEMDQYARLNDALQVEESQLSGAKVSTPSGPYFAPTPLASGGTEASTPTGGIKLAEFDIPDPGYEYRVLCFGQVEVHPNSDFLQMVFGSGGLFAKAGIISVYAGLRLVGMGLGTSGTIYDALPIVPFYGDTETPMSGPTKITAYAYVTSFGTGGTRFTSHEGHLGVYLLPD